MRRVLSDIGRGTAILATKRQALQAAQDDQDDGGRDADCLAAGKEAHGEGGGAHDHDGNEECVLPAHQIAQATKHQRTEGADQEARGEGQKREDVAGVFRVLAEELGADDRRQRTVEIEIVPFENCAEGGGEDDLLLFLRHGTVDFRDARGHAW